MAIRRAVKLCHEEKDWLRYNDWIENRVNSEIKLNISNNFKSSTLAFVFNNRAYYERGKGNIALALENYFKIIKVSEDYIAHQNENVKGGKYNYKSEALVYAYNNIGLIYFEKDNLVLSELYSWKKSFIIRKGLYALLHF